MDKGTYTLSISSTYGQTKRWIVHPINAAVELGANKVGPLEMTFFLNN